MILRPFGVRRVKCSTCSILRRYRLVLSFRPRLRTIANRCRGEPLWSPFTAPKPAVLWWRYGNRRITFFGGLGVVSKHRLPRFSSQIYFRFAITFSCSLCLFQYWLCDDSRQHIYFGQTSLEGSLIPKTTGTFQCTDRSPS